ASGGGVALSVTTTLSTSRLRSPLVQHSSLSNVTRISCVPAAAVKVNGNGVQAVAVTVVLPMATPPTLTTMCGPIPDASWPCAVTVMVLLPATNGWFVEMKPFDQMFQPSVTAPPVECVIVSASYVVVSADWTSTIESSSAPRPPARQPSATTQTTTAL